MHYNEFSLRSGRKLYFYVKENHHKVDHHCNILNNFLENESNL